MELKAGEVIAIELFSFCW